MPVLSVLAVVVLGELAVLGVICTGRLSAAWTVQQEPAENPAAAGFSAFRLAHVWTLPGGLKVWLYTRPY